MDITSHAIEQLRDNSDDLEQAAKAIFDSLREILTAEFKSLLENQAEELEKRFGLTITETRSRIKSLERMIEQKSHQVFKECEEQIREHRTYQQREWGQVATLVKSLAIPSGGNASDVGVDIVMNVTKMLEDRFERRLATSEQLVRESVTSMKEYHAGELNSIKELLRSLPSPTANITLPEMSPTVNLPQLAVKNEVMLPEVKPEIKNIIVPPARRTCKHLEYDEYSRPVKIIEEEV